MVYGAEDFWAWRHAKVIAKTLREEVVTEAPTITIEWLVEGVCFHIMARAYVHNPTAYTWAGRIRWGVITTGGERRIIEDYYFEQEPHYKEYLLFWEWDKWAYKVFVEVKVYPEMHAEWLYGEIWVRL